MLSDFGLCRRDEITTIPNGHEHVKRWCPHRSPFAAMEENRRPFVCLLGGRARTRRSRCCFPSPEIDALKLDIWAAGASGMYFFAIDSRPLPSNLQMLGSSPTTISRRSHSVLLRLSVGDGAVRDAQSSPPTRRGGLRLPRFSLIRSRRARLARRDRTPPCRTRPCTRSVREGCPNRAFFMENKRPGLLDLITSLFPGTAREQKGEVDPSMQSAKALHGGTPS
jgi:hypothetical protein